MTNTGSTSNHFLISWHLPHLMTRDRMIQARDKKQVRIPSQGSHVEVNAADARLRARTSIQRDAPTDISRNIQIFTFVNRRLTFVEATFGNNLQRQLALLQLRGGFALASGACAVASQELLHLLGWQGGRRGDKSRAGASRVRLA